MKSIQKLGSFGAAYIEVKKMAEMEIECGERENVIVMVSGGTHRGSQQEEQCHQER